MHPYLITPNYEVVMSLAHLDHSSLWCGWCFNAAIPRASLIVPKETVVMVYYILTLHGLLLCLPDISSLPNLHLNCKPALVTVISQQFFSIPPTSPTLSLTQEGHTDLIGITEIPIYPSSQSSSIPSPTFKH